ncbi:carboxypeptidase B-like [Aphomia sociella]
MYGMAPTKNVTQVWEVKFIREGQRYFIKSLDTVGAINIWKEEHSTMDIMVEGPRAAQVAGMLHEREIPYSVAIRDVNVNLDREQSGAVAKPIKRNSAGIRRNMDWKNYHRLDVIYAFLYNLTVDYPYLCSVNVIGKSAEGRDIKMLKISNGNKDNAGVWLDGSIHSREWISTAVVTYIADQLVKTYHEQPDSITNKDWFIVPVLNPDGYEYTHTHDRMWRKNRAKYGECIGVDLNRNFSYGWGEKGEEGSSEDPGNIFFRGPKPFSEPETAAVRRTIIESDSTFKVFLSFHSYGEVIIFPWGYTSDPCPDYVELLEGGTVMAKAIHETNGNTYKVGSTKDLMYFAAGTSTDWSYAVASIPYSYMVELRGKKHRFLLPKEEIVSTSVEIFNGVLRLMDFVDGRCRSTQSCVCSK